VIETDEGAEDHQEIPRLEGNQSPGRAMTTRRMRVPLGERSTQAHGDVG
jgi:hypothetical protein